MAKRRITTRREAILEGAKAAGILHRELGIQNVIAERLSSVDVYSAISDLNITLLFKDLNGPLGLCIPGVNPGILINRGRPPMMQRFTAAHELGHIYMEHSGSIDYRIFEVVEAAEKDVPLNEVAADAFASEFLLPKWLLILLTRKYGWANKEALANPSIVYQLSLRAGVSFEAIAWALKNHGVLAAKDFNSIRATAPKTHKSRLLGTHALPHPWNDVWHFDLKDDGLTYDIRQGDYVVLDLPSIESSGYVWEFAESGSGFEIKEDHYLEAAAGDQVGGAAIRRVTLFMKDSGRFALRLDERRPWKKEDASRATFQSEFKVSKQEVGGLPNSARVRLAS